MNSPENTTAEIPVTKHSVQSLLSSFKKFATIAEVMRMLGAAALVASMALLLVNGWHDGDDIYRYLKLLGLTALFAAGGFSMSYLLREQKGARLFFSLGLIAVPANFAIIAALIFSMVPDLSLVSTYPSFAKWVAVDATQLVMVGAGALCILLPISVLGFRIIARDSARLLTFAYIGLNSLLLLPFRGSLAVGLILAITLIIPVLVTRISLLKDATLLSVRGKYALAILYIPALLLLTRNLYLYELDSFLGLVLFSSIYWVCRQWLGLDTATCQSKQILRLITAFTAPGIGLCLAYLIASTPLNQSFYIIFSLLLCAYLVDFDRWASRSRIDVFINYATIAAIMSSTIFGILLFDTATTAIAGSTIGLGLIAFGIYSKKIFSSINGLALSLIACWFGLQDVIMLLIQGDWLALAFAGGIAIVSASLLDRFGANIKFRLRKRWDNQTDSRVLD